MPTEKSARRPVAREEIKRPLDHYGAEHGRAGAWLNMAGEQQTNAIMAQAVFAIEGAEGDEFDCARSIIKSIRDEASRAGVYHRNFNTLFGPKWDDSNPEGDASG